MKSKVEQYAKGDFYVEYPDVKLSKSYLQLKIEAGSIYLNITFVTSANTDEEGYALLKHFGLPFKNAKK